MAISSPSFISSQRRLSRYYPDFADATTSDGGTGTDVNFSAAFAGVGTAVVRASDDPVYLGQVPAAKADHFGKDRVAILARIAHGLFVLRVAAFPPAACAPRTAGQSRRLI
jgi:hypothetical protein